MRTFKRFLEERKSITPEVLEKSKELQDLLSKKLGKLSKTISIDKETNKMQTIRITSPDRIQCKEEVPKILKNMNDISIIDTYVGSVGSYDIQWNDYTFRLIFKPVSGGMTETTLNSTITELVPAILFMSGKEFTDVNECLEYLLQGNYDKSVYINSKDAKAGKDFINAMDTSSKFKEKMENAFGVLKYLKELNTQTPIKNVYWGYRAKPEGITKNHKGDIFVKFTNDSMLGVSLKAGGEKTDEPKLNTYVRPVLEKLGIGTTILENIIYQNIHSQMGLPKNWSVKNNLSEIIEWRKNNNEDELYDKMLETCRLSVCDAFGADVEKTKKYIQSEILAIDESAPLVVVKAVSTGYKMLTEEDDIEVFLPSVKRVKCYPGTSKQNFHIELSNNTESLTLNMSIRTNKSIPENKLAQGFNLAVKFNSVSKG